MNELQARLGPLPLWGWLVAGAALGGAALLFWHRQGGSSRATLGQSQQKMTEPNYNYSSLDPLTGVPYSVESQVNPNTGLPNYYNSPPSATPPAPGRKPAEGPIVPVGPSGGVNPPGMGQGFGQAFLDWFSTLSPQQQQADTAAYQALSPAQQQQFQALPLAQQQQLAQSYGSGSAPYPQAAATWPYAASSTTYH